MKLPNTSRLHALRMENDAARYAMQDMAPRFHTLQHRAENGTAPRAVVAYQLFQTPADLAARMVDLLNIPAGSRILEPSAGLGRLLEPLGKTQPSEIVAVETAPDCAHELFRQDRARVTIKQRDFLEVFPEDIGHFHFVVMNPPFHMRSDIKHIEHALTFLRPGGRLAALCMDTDHRERALRHQADTWEKIPAGTFRQEGTDVPTILLTITAQ